MLSFYSDKSISDDALVKELQKSNVSLKYLGIKRVDKSGPIAHYYELEFQTFQNMRKMVDFLTTLATQESAVLFCDDEGPNPYQFIRFEPGKEPVSIYVEPVAYDERDEIWPQGGDSQVWGTVAVPNELSSDEQNKIIDLLGATSVRSMEGFDKSYFDSYFRTAQNNIASLREFNWFYFLVAPEGSPWTSRKERGLLLTENFMALSKTIPYAFCLFPANSEDIQNIPGGSDSERFCLVITDGIVEKIIYKERRKSW